MPSENILLNESSESAILARRVLVGLDRFELTPHSLLGLSRVCTRRFFFTKYLMLSGVSVSASAKTIVRKSPQVDGGWVRIGV